MTERPSDALSNSPGLASYLKSLRHHPSDVSADRLIALLKRRQIHQSRPCANATVHLFLRVVEESKSKTAAELLNQIRELGKRLSRAQPREYAVGNIVRRVLGLIREAAEPGEEGESKGTKSANAFVSYGSTVRKQIEPSHIPRLNGEQKQGAMKGAEENQGHTFPSMREVKEDVLNGLREMLDEVDQADEQIAGYAQEHISSQEVIMTCTSSFTVQKFLLQAAKRRKFTVIMVEGYPNEHVDSYDTIINGRRESDRDETAQGDRLKPLTASGVNVILLPESAVFAVMPKVSKVVLPAHAVFEHGGVSVAAGSGMIAHAAKAHGVPVVVLSAIYKLSPLRPVNAESTQEFGDPSALFDWRDGELEDKVEAVNPLSDYIPPELVELFVTNIGGHAPSYMYRIAADHYRDEDTNLG